MNKRKRIKELEKKLKDLEIEIYILNNKLETIRNNNKRYWKSLRTPLVDKNE